MTPINAMNDRHISVSDTAKVRYPSVRRSSRGVAALQADLTPPKAATRTAPTTSVRIAGSLRGLGVDADLAQAVDERAEPERGEYDAGPVDVPGRGSPTLVSLPQSDRAMPSAIGTTAKIHRHEPSWRKHSGNGWAERGATDIASVTLPMTLPRSRGATVISVVISSGIITAVPLAWTTGRPAAPRSPARGRRDRVPAEKQPMATVNARRVVTRWRNQPVIGMTTQWSA